MVYQLDVQKKRKKSESKGWLVKSCAKSCCKKSRKDRLGKDHKNKKKMIGKTHGQSFKRSSHLRCKQFFENPIKSVRKNMGWLIIKYL